MKSMAIAALLRIIQVFNFSKELRHFGIKVTGDKKGSEPSDEGDSFFSESLELS